MPPLKLPYINLSFSLTYALKINTFLEGFVILHLLKTLLEGEQALGIESII